MGQTESASIGARSDATNERTSTMQVLVAQKEGFPSVRVFEVPKAGARLLGEIPSNSKATALLEESKASMAFIKVRWQHLEGWIGVKNVKDVDPSEDCIPTEKTSGDSWRGGTGSSSKGGSWRFDGGKDVSSKGDSWRADGGKGGSSTGDSWTSDGGEGRFHGADGPRPALPEPTTDDPRVDPPPPETATIDLPPLPPPMGTPRSSGLASSRVSDAASSSVVEETQRKCFIEQSDGFPAVRVYDKPGGTLLGEIPSKSEAILFVDPSSTRFHKVRWKHLEGWVGARNVKHWVEDWVESKHPVLPQTRDAPLPEPDDDSLVPCLDASSERWHEEEPLAGLEEPPASPSGGIEPDDMEIAAITEEDVVDLTGMWTYGDGKYKYRLSWVKGTSPPEYYFKERHSDHMAVTATLAKHGEWYTGRVLMEKKFWGHVRLQMGRARMDGSETIISNFREGDDEWGEDVVAVPDGLEGLWVSPEGVTFRINSTQAYPPVYFYEEYPPTGTKIKAQLTKLDDQWLEGKLIQDSKEKGYVRVALHRGQAVTRFRTSRYKNWSQDKFSTRESRTKRLRRNRRKLTERMDEKGEAG